MWKTPQFDGNCISDGKRNSKKQKRNPKLRKGKAGKRERKQGRGSENATHSDSRERAWWLLLFLSDRNL